MARRRLWARKSDQKRRYRQVFGEIWERLQGPLLRARTAEEAIQAFAEAASRYPEYFVPTLAPLILKVVRDREFPKRREAQINFLADSLAGRGRVSPRRSRDICHRERNKKVNYIIRRECYIECTCRYKGPALHGKCPKCGAESLLPPGIEWGLKNP